MEEAKNKEKKQPEKTDEKEREKEKGQQPSGKDKDKKEEQELVSLDVFSLKRALGEPDVLFCLSHCRFDNTLSRPERTAAHRYIHD